MGASEFLIIKAHCAIPMHLEPIVTRILTEWAAGDVTNYWLVRLVSMVDPWHQTWAQCAVWAVENITLP